MALSDYLQSPTIDAIERGVEEREGQRSYPIRISPSMLGEECERKAWLSFHWAFDATPFDGKQLRRFEAGRVDEARMVAWLRLAGVNVDDMDMATGRQHSVSAMDGHFYGAIDGKATGIIEAPKTPHLVECKAINAKAFAQLKRHGVAVALPKHMAQVQVYMHLLGLTRTFYLAKNKDSDELHVERIHYDGDQAIRLMAKAERIGADTAPAKANEDPGGWPCSMCDAASVCHGAAMANRNCRTCIHLSRVSRGDFFCNRHGVTVTTQSQRAGCPHHLYLPSLVDGEQVDADEAAETITYQMNNGREWIDGREETHQ